MPMRRAATPVSMTRAELDAPILLGRVPRAAARRFVNTSRLCAPWTTRKSVAFGLRQATC